MTSMPHLTLMQWDFKDQLSATSRQAVNATPPPDKVPETTYYVYDAGGQRVRKVTERQNGTRKAERIYLGGFEIYREFDGNGTDIALERETLHIMDDKQRIALVETRTQGNDGSPPQLIRYQFGNHLGSASLELDDKAQRHFLRGVLPRTAARRIRRWIRASKRRRSGIGIRGRSGMRRRGLLITGRGITRRGWDGGRRLIRRESSRV